MRWLVLVFLAWPMASLAPSLHAQPGDPPTESADLEIDNDPDDDDDPEDEDETQRFSFWPGVSDNRTHTITSTTVSPGHTIYEFTMSRTRNDDRGVKTTTDEIMETKIRTSLGDRAELTVGFAGFINEDTEMGATPKMNESGYGDLRIGTKVQLRRNAEKGYSSALYFQMALPTGSRSVSSRRVDPKVGITWSKYLKGNKGLRTFGSVGVSWESDQYSTDNDFDTLASLDWSAGLGFAGLAAEFYGDAGLSRQGGPRNHFRVSGSTIYASEAGNFQSSIYGAWGLSEDANDWEYGIALSFWRRPARSVEAKMDTD